MLMNENSHMLKAKHDLFSICQQKSSELVGKYNPELARILSCSNKALDALFTELLKVFQDIHCKYKQKGKSSRGPEKGGEGNKRCPRSR